MGSLLSSCIHGDSLATMRELQSETLMTLSLLVTGPRRWATAWKNSLWKRGWTMGAVMKSNLKNKSTPIRRALNSRPFRDTSGFNHREGAASLSSDHDYNIIINVILMEGLPSNFFPSFCHFHFSMKGLIFFF